MHILIIRTATAIGGAEIYNLRLIEGFKKYYPDVSFSFITNLEEFGDRLREIGVPGEVIPIFNEEIGTKKGLLRLLKIYPIYLYKYIRAIQSINKKQKIDIVLMEALTEKIALTFLLKICRYKYIWIEHGMFQTDKKSIVINLIYKLLANKIIVISDAVKKDLDKLNLNNILIVKTGSKIQKVQNKNNNNFNSNIKIVTYIGSITKGKGVIDFLEISKIIIKRGLNVKFLIIGKGELMNWFNKSINDISEYYYIKGYIKNVISYINRSDLYLFPSYSEGLSLTILEFMAMGVPVIARDIGGNNELVIHNKTGLLFKNESHEEIADMVIELLNDPERRKKMGEAARERIKKYFSEERWIREMNQAFEEVVNAKS